jgi:hypothetical protein
MMKLPSQFDITIDNTAPEDAAMPFPYPKIISNATNFDINDDFSTHK